MKKIFLAIGVGMIAFVVGLVGTYIALPMVAPGVTSSLAPADSTVAADSVAATTDLPRPLPNGAAPDSASTDQPEPSLASVDAIESLRDSLAMMQDSVQTLAATEETLTREVDALRDQVQSLQATQAKAAEMAKTLTKLEDEALQSVLQELDMRIFQMLYAESTGRTQARLLQALPPERAARVVDSMMASDN
jgi:outer membrane murein-binding lipoprotein Lpp